MKTVSAGFQTHLDGELTKLATCWKIVRKDSTEFHFTSHDTDIVFDGDTYLSIANYDISAIENTGDMAVDGLELTGILESGYIEEDDVKFGLFDSADVWLFAVIWDDIAQGNLKLRKGEFGEVQIHNGTYKVEIRGLTQKLQQEFVDLYSPSCRADLGDAKCGVNLAARTESDTVATVTVSKQAFTGTSGPVPVGGNEDTDGYFSGGLLTWTSGNNNGLSFEIKEYNTSPIIGLYIPTPFTITVGDTYDYTPGCFKTLTHCRDKFNNVINFRGEPFVPGEDEIFRYPA